MPEPAIVAGENNDGVVGDPLCLKVLNQHPQLDVHFPHHVQMGRLFQHPDRIIEESRVRSMGNVHRLTGVVHVERRVRVVVGVFGNEVLGRLQVNFARLGGIEIPVSVDSVLARIVKIVRQDSIAVRIEVDRPRSGIGRAARLEEFICLRSGRRP